MKFISIKITQKKWLITGSFGEPSTTALIYGTLAKAAVNDVFKRMWKGALMVYFN